MTDLLANPLLALIGFVIVVAVLIAPLVLRLAGLSGSQIGKLLVETMRFIRDTVHEFRCDDKR